MSDRGHDAEGGIGLARLHERVALVVGGGGSPEARPSEPMSNGQAISLRLGSEGATVAVADLDPARAAHSVEALGGAGLAIEADVRDPRSCVDAVEATIRAFGRIDIVVCNVGISGREPLRVQSIADWEMAMSVNAASNWLVAQAALPTMLRQGRGVFLFISSLAATLSHGRSLSYEASKAAQLAISRHIGVRYADRGIRSNALILGVIDSAMVRRMFGDSAERASLRDDMCPMRRQGTPQEVAAAAAFLVCDDSSYVTGTELVVDGGRSADGTYERRLGGSRGRE